VSNGVNPLLAGGSKHPTTPWSIYKDCPAVWTGYEFWAFGEEGLETGVLMLNANWNDA